MAHVYDNSFNGNSYNSMNANESAHPPIHHYPYDSVLSVPDAFLPSHERKEAEEEGRLELLRQLQQQLTQLPSDQLRVLLANGFHHTVASALHYQARDWNGEFQQLLEQIGSDETILDNEEVFVSLSDLARDFAFAAQTLGRIIISERYLQNKTIEPVQTTGVAGGVKYICHNILFKFAYDEHGLYGSDENASKAAGHELKGLTNVYRCVAAEQQLHVPLCCLIDFRGFRLIAVSRVPVSEDTIVYGSDDGGQSIHADNSEFCLRMAKMAQILNLKPHTVNDATGRAATICGAFDTEGHLGLDQRFYLLDFHRTFPAEPPRVGEGNTQLFKLLRPELVAANDTPLCSDAFSATMSNAESDREVHSCYQRLIEHVLPAFGEWLSLQRLGGPEHHYFTSYLHQAGINIRHLGLLRGKVSEEKWRVVILIEVLARVLKNLFRSRARSLIRKIRYLSTEPFRKDAVRFINSVFTDSQETRGFWSEQLKEEIEKRFVAALNKEEASDGFDLFAKMKPYLIPLFHRFVAMTGLQVDGNFLRKLEENLSKEAAEVLVALKTTEAKRLVTEHEEEVKADALWPMEDVHLVEIVEKVKQMNIVPYAEGTAFFIKSRRKLCEAKMKEADYLAQLCRSKFDEALRYNLNDELTLCNYAFLMQTVYSDRIESVKLLKRALFANKFHVRSWYYLGICMRDLKHEAEAKECFQKSLQCSKFSHPNSLKDYANLLRFNEKNLVEAEEYYKKTIAVKPDHINGLKNYATLKISLAKQLSDYEEAMELLYRSAQSTSGDLLCQSNAARKCVQLGRVFAELLTCNGEKAKAKQVYLQCLRVYPQDSRLNLAYAVFLFEQLSEEREAMERYLLNGWISRSRVESEVEAEKYWEQSGREWVPSDADVANAMKAKPECVARLSKAQLKQRWYPVIQLPTARQAVSSNMFTPNSSTVTMSGVSEEEKPIVKQRMSIPLPSVPTSLVRQGSGGADGVKDEDEKERGLGGKELEAIWRRFDKVMNSQVKESAKLMTLMRAASEVQKEQELPRKNPSFDRANSSTVERKRGGRSKKKANWKLSRCAYAIYVGDFYDWIGEKSKADEFYRMAEIVEDTDSRSLSVYGRYLWRVKGEVKKARVYLETSCEERGPKKRWEGKRLHEVVSEGDDGSERMQEWRVSLVALESLKEFVEESGEYEEEEAAMKVELLDWRIQQMREENTEDELYLNCLQYELPLFYLREDSEHKRLVFPQDVQSDSVLSKLIRDLDPYGARSHLFFPQQSQSNHNKNEEAAAAAAVLWNGGMALGNRKRIVRMSANAMTKKKSEEKPFELDLDGISELIEEDDNKRESKEEQDCEQTGGDEAAPATAAAAVVTPIKEEADGSRVRSSQRRKHPKAKGGRH